MSFALAWAEVLEASDIFIGVNALDYSGYPDCRPEYIAAYERMANLSTKAGVGGRQRLRIHAPLIQLTKAEIVRMGTKLGVDYALTSIRGTNGENGGKFWTAAELAAKIEATWPPGEGPAGAFRAPAPRLLFSPTHGWTGSRGEHPENSGILQSASAMALEPKGT